MNEPNIAIDAELSPADALMHDARNQLQNVELWLTLGDQERARRSWARLADLADLGCQLDTPPRRRTWRISDVLDDLLSDQPGARDVQVRLPAGLCIYADRRGLDRVLANLVSNALRHGRGAPAWVTALPGANNTETILRVVDQGPGIPEGVRRCLFRPGCRAADSPGLGLGLAGARRIVEAHGGQIWMDEVPRGTSIGTSWPAG